MLKYLPIIIFFMLFIFLNITKTISSPILIILTTFIFGGIWIKNFPKTMEKAITKSILKGLKEGKTNDFIGYQTLELTDDYIIESNSYTNLQLKYSTVERISSGHNLIYIYLGAIKAIIIPISTFENEEQKNNFFKIIYEKTGISITN